MLTAEELITVQVEPQKQTIRIGYQPQTTRTLFDICDISGRILKTGLIDAPKTEVRVEDLQEGVRYIVLVLDGDRVNTVKFKL